MESFGDKFVAEIIRVLQAEGIVLVQSFTPSSDQKVIHGTLVAQLLTSVYCNVNLAQLDFTFPLQY
jgi:ubiquinone/menaquinone biosynthesis C-methylase UbiE